MFQKEMFSLYSWFRDAISWRRFVTLGLLFLTGCGVNPEFKKNIIGVWEGSKGQRHWCMKLTANGQINLAQMFGSGDGIQGNQNSAIRLRHFSGTWSLGLGKRFIAELAPIEPSGTEHLEDAKFLKSIYFIKQLQDDAFIYTDASYENTFVNARVDHCSEKFELTLANKIN